MNNSKVSILENWLEWDGDSSFEIPARNTTAKDGKLVSILIDEQGVGVYNCPVEVMLDQNYSKHTDVHLVEVQNPVKEIVKLKEYLSDELISECLEVYKRYNA